MHGPRPDEKYPMKGFSQVVFLKNFITKPNIVVGDYTYYDDPGGPEEFENKNVLYHYPFMEDKLIIGKFCAIATGAKFIMNGANHKISGFSCYPFSLFGNGWDKVIPKLGDLPYKGDTVVGNDVWIGYEAIIMPGIHIGDGAIIGAKAVVTKNVSPYTVVAGNPSQVVRDRFDKPTKEKLLKIKWWDWNIDKLTENLSIITGSNIAVLEKVA
ncbi:MAG: Vat family streptogramin A O-acetyltransferase [Patescibacteria group bacterium]